MKPEIKVWTTDTCGCNTYRYFDENGDVRYIEYEEAVLLHNEIYKNYPESTLSPDKHPQPEDKTCEFHAKIATAEEHFNTVLAENENKNLMEKHLVENMPDHVDIVMNEDGSMSKQWKKGVKYDWSFDENRELLVDIKGIVPVDKVALDSVVKQQLPTAKVK